MYLTIWYGRNPFVHSTNPRRRKLTVFPTADLHARFSSCVKTFALSNASTCIVHHNNCLALLHQGFRQNLNPLFLFFSALDNHLNCPCFIFRGGAHIFGPWLWMENYFFLGVFVNHVYGKVQHVRG